MHLHRPTLPTEAHLEFFTPFQKGTKTERFRTIANALVDSTSSKNGLLAVPGMNLSLLVELLTSMGVGWFDAMGYDNKTELTNEIASKLINKANAFLASLNFHTEANGLVIKTNRITAPIAAQLMLLDWPYVDWFGTDWNWMKNFGSKFSFSDWDKINEELDKLKFALQKTPTQPDFFEANASSKIVSNPSKPPFKELGITWSDIPYNIAWGRIPFGKLRPWMYEYMPQNAEKFIEHLREQVGATHDTGDEVKSTPFPGSTNPIGTLDQDALGGLLGGGTTIHFPGNVDLSGGGAGGTDGGGGTAIDDGSSTDTSFVDGCTAQGKFTFPGVDRCLTLQDLQDIWQKQADCARTPGSTFDPVTLTCKTPEAPQPKLCSDGLPEDPTTGCQRTEPKTEDKAEEKKSSTGMILAGVGILAIVAGGAWWMSKERTTTPPPASSPPPPMPSYASNPLHPKSKKRSPKSKHH